MSTTARSTATSSACARSSAKWIPSSTRSKPSMASATDTARAEPRRRTSAPADHLAEAPAAEAERPRRRLTFGWLPGTRLGRLIIALNVLGLAILIAGALVLNELRRGLVDARIDSLTTQGELMASIMDEYATAGEPEPMMNSALGSQMLQMLANPKTQRARLFDAHGNVVADSDWVADRVQARLLPPARKRGEKAT